MKTRAIQIIWIGLTLTSLWVFGNVIYWLVGYFQNPSAKLVTALADAGFALNLFFALNILFVCFVYFSFFIVAQLIMLRRPRERFSLLAAVVLLAFGTTNAAPALPEIYQYYFHLPPVIGVPFYVINFLGWTLIPAFAISYPDGKFVPRWALVVALWGAIVSVFWTTNAEVFSTVQGIWAALLLVIVILGYAGIVYAQIWRYRHYYSPLQKQQVKWFVVGILGIVATVVPTIIFLPASLESQVTPHELLRGELIYMLVGCGYVILPLSVGVAILRYRLWDIDIIIRKTVTYVLVVALLLFVYFGSVILLQQVFANVTGQRSEWITIVSTLAIAALFVPLRNRIQNAIDRRFYRKKYDAQKVLREFAETVRDETDLDKLTGELLNVVNETMQPKSVSVWLKRTTDDRQRSKTHE